MNDNEIVKALECCSKDNVKDCDYCPYDDIETKTYCANELIKDALDLINRQKADIERLEREIEDLESTQEISPEAKYLVDTKADKIIALLDEFNKSQEQIKSEAIKEFAERLKEKCGYIAWDGISPAMVDDLVEEMNYESSKTEKQRKESDRRCQLKLLKY